MNIIKQLKLNTEEYINKREDNMKFTVKPRKVRRKTLIKDLLKLRASFMAWDNERRRKVDLVLTALEPEDRYINIERVKERLNRIAEGDELLPAAQKMLELHYRSLSMNVIERSKAYRRSKRARRKLKRITKRK